MIHPVFELFNVRKIIDYCADIAHSNGIYGDPGQQTNRIGTQGQEWQIIDLVHQVPDNIYRFDSILIRQVMRNLVMSHRDELHEATGNPKDRKASADAPKPKRKRKSWSQLAEETQQ